MYHFVLMGEIKKQYLVDYCWCMGYELLCVCDSSPSPYSFLHSVGFFLTGLLRVSPFIKNVLVFSARPGPVFCDASRHWWGFGAASRNSADQGARLAPDLDGNASTRGRGLLGVNWCYGKKRVQGKSGDKDHTASFAPGFLESSTVYAY